MVIYWGRTCPWGRRHWVGINFCHPEVVKLQQQCHMQNTIFDLPQTTGSIHFFFWEGECQYPGDSNRIIGRTNENDNPLRKWYICSSIITLMFGFFMALGHSGFRHGLGETGKTLQKGCFMLLSPREIHCVGFSVFNVFS